jgi:ATP-dependent protease HslVU (ClpYQ) peptidase subunit
MVTVFAEAVRKLLKDTGAAKINSNEEDSESSFIVAYRGGLYSLERDYQVHTYSEGFTASGSGREFALAVMYAMRETLPPRERIERAIETAAHLCTSVCLPFVVLEAE